MISRGCSLNELVKHDIWWHGPQNFLANYNYDQQLISLVSIPDQKTISLPVNIKFHPKIFDRSSNLTTLVNIIAYSLRFISNCKTHVRVKSELKINERKASLTLLIKLAQEHNYHDEHFQLKNGRSVESSSSILTLNPVLDSDELIRLGVD